MLPSSAAALACSKGAGAVRSTGRAAEVGAAAATCGAQVAHGKAVDAGHREADERER